MTTTLAAPAPAPPRPVRPSGTPPPATIPRLRWMRYEPEPGTACASPAAPFRRPPPPAVPSPSEAERAAVRCALAGCVRLAMEVFDGRRPPAQLRHHFDPGPLRYWRAAIHQRQMHTPARVVRMVLCLPQPHGAEISAVCDIDGRVRALAARFDRAGAGAEWRCTALRLG